MWGIFAGLLFCNKLDNSDLSHSLPMMSLLPLICTSVNLHSSSQLVDSHMLRELLLVPRPWLAPESVHSSSAVSKDTLPAFQTRCIHTWHGRGISIHHALLIPWVVSDRIVCIYTEVDVWRILAWKSLNSCCIVSLQILTGVLYMQPGGLEFYTLVSFTLPWKCIHFYPQSFCVSSPLVVLKHSSC